MKTNAIFSVGFELPNEEKIEFKSFDSSASLLDADIILFEPRLEYDKESFYKGKANLSEYSSSTCIKNVKHWCKELRLAFECGKTIFLFLNSFEEVWYKTGEKSYTGTGKNRSITHHVDLVTNYEMIPLNFKNLESANGRRVKLSKDASILSSYWEIVEKFSNHKVYFEIDDIRPLLITEAAGKVVGGICRHESGGSIILLPSLDFPDSFTEQKDDREYWTQEAETFSKKFLHYVVEIDKSLRTSVKNTPAPEWVQEERFKLKLEEKYLNDISELERQIEKLNEGIQLKRREMIKLTSLKCLLYENGKILEDAIIAALQLIGFTAENYNDGKSEFDIVFESEEGRFIGEAEGRDNAPIAITKFRQLESNIHEDFEREEVATHAKGVLFGNPFRLIHPDNRKEYFTKKAIESAKRTDIALINTHDLFEVAKYLKGYDDRTYAKRIRECIKNACGEIVKFPKPPYQNTP